MFTSGATNGRSACNFVCFSFSATAFIISFLRCAAVCSELSNFHFDLFWFRFLCFRQRHREDAVLVGSLDFTGVHRNRQRERSLEFSEEPFRSISFSFLPFLLFLPLARERQHIPVERDFDVFLLHAGNFGLEYQVVAILVKIHRWQPAAEELL